MTEYSHKTVLRDETLDLLQVRGEGLWIDATVGGAGHSRLIAERMAPDGRLLCIDRDVEAIAAAQRALSGFAAVSFVKGNFADIKDILRCVGESGAEGVVADLGVSSHQLDEPERGFSYMRDSRLDMRMDRSASLTAYDIVNGYPRDRLERVLLELGEERWAKRIADFIAARRADKPIETTLELVGAVKAAVPKGARETGHHPAKKTFMAIRYETNGEISMLPGAVRDMAEILRPGGRLCVITFNGLEDRIVKSVFRELANPCVCPPDFPQCVCGRTPTARIITTKPVLPSQAEIADNPRARSAKLRAAERI
ncbi:MAG: 16S rRNA (cytosine(1402)-N(4))-methyltransferase RsmH [Clostridiales bacterium]|jgi:16S rRNA (cytosine1402-N4)-methyltransferase|nr:16S rRNA (cytosine(1402)-N(4))-methyltransferase RsmH [Clostridiales bacterium]